MGCVGGSGFDVGERSEVVPSRVQHCHSTLSVTYTIFVQILFALDSNAILQILPSCCQWFTSYLPSISIGTSSEPDRNLIGTSPND